MNKQKKGIILSILFTTFLLISCGKTSYDATFTSTEFSVDSDFDKQLIESTIKDQLITLEVNQKNDSTELIMNIKFTPALRTNYELTGDMSSLIWLYDTNNINNEIYFNKDTVEITNGVGIAKAGEVVNITYKGILERQLTKDEIKEICQITIHFENFAGDPTPLVCKISEMK